MIGLLFFSIILTTIFTYIFWDKLSKENIILGSLFFIVHISSYLFTCLANPGIPNKNKYYSNPFSTVGIKRYKVCKKCQLIMNLDKQTYHCKSCEICVEGNFFILNIFIYI